MRVIVVGDCTLDVMVRPAGTIRAGSDIPAEVVVGPGGQGANVAVRLARQGVSVRLVSALADDGAGRLLAAALGQEGVELVRLPASRSGTVVVLLDAGGERAMLSERVSLDPSALGAALEDGDWLHASGYALADTLSGAALADALATRHARSRVSVAGGSFPSDASVVARVLARLESLSPDLLILNRDEAAALLEGIITSLTVAASDLAACLPGTLAIVTGGPQGSAAAGHGMAAAVSPEAPIADMIDSTGAGDAYTAGIIAALADVEWPPDAAALRAAMQRAGRLGAQASRVLGAQGHIPGERDTLR